MFINLNSTLCFLNLFDVSGWLMRAIFENLCDLLDRRPIYFPEAIPNCALPH